MIQAWYGSLSINNRLTAQKYFINHISSFWQVISFTRGPFLFVFNFNPELSYELHRVGVDEAGEYQVSYA
jgi:1,4-alpha-glucan branching enzyme